MSHSSFNQTTGHKTFLWVIMSLIVLASGGIELLHRLFLKPQTATILPNTMMVKENLFPRTLQDTFGKTMMIPKKPQRILSQTLATDEILLELCPPEHIIALSMLAGNQHYSHVVEQAKHFSSVPSQVEAILMLNPDLVFVATYNRAEMVNLLRATGSPVIRLNQFNNIHDIKNNIRLIGYAIGEDQRAHLLIHQMEETIATIRQQIPKERLFPRMLFYDPFGYTAGRHTVFDDMAHLVYGINLASEQGIEGYVQLNQEFIYKWQPDFIVTSAVLGEFEQIRHRLLENKMIATSTAGKRGQIIVLDQRDVNATSHHIISAMISLFKGLYLSSHPLSD